MSLAKEKRLNLRQIYFSSGTKYFINSFLKLAKIHEKMWNKINKPDYKIFVLFKTCHDCER